MDGWPTTDLARTVVDLARSLPFEQGVAAADRALALGATVLELEAALARAGRLRGAGAARRVVAFADGRSESVGESLSRVLLADLGLMPEDLQHRVMDGPRLAGRVDFAWPSLRVIGEFDGRVKYGRLLEADEDAGDAVFREKRREDRLRELGWEVVRWVWADLAHPEVIAERLRRAFARAASAARMTVGARPAHPAVVRTPCRVCRCEQGVPTSLGQEVGRGSEPPQSAARASSASMIVYA